MANATFAEFLEEFGLYRKYPHDDGGDLPSPSIRRFCETCGSEHTWVEGNVAERLWLSGGLVRRNPLGGNYTGWFLWLHYFCTGCKRTPLDFILYFEDSSSKSSRPANSETDLAAPGTASGSSVIKVGQYPPSSIEPPKELRDALGKHASLFKKGMICESQGYGIGAFAYYRHIVEDIIDDMLADICDLLEPDDRAKYDSALAAVDNTIVADEKIKVVKDMLPASLRPGGVNPLGILHSALSVGIHELNEDDCVALADAVRSSLWMLAKHIALAKQDKEEYAASISSVKGRLDKIKAKQSGKA